MARIQFGTPRADQTGEAKDLALAKLEGAMLQLCVREVLNVENDLAALGALAGTNLADGAADHHFDDVVFRQALDVAGGRYIAAVAKNGDAVADIKGLVHAVRNIDNADALGFQIADDLVKLLDFLLRQRRSRFVHDNDLCIVRNSTGDFHHLLLCDAKLADRHMRIQRHPHVVQNFLRIRIQFLVVDKPKRTGGLFAAVDVLGDGHIRAHGQFLHGSWQRRALLLWSENRSRPSRRPGRSSPVSAE